jgi:hypothetical protein
LGLTDLRYSGGARGGNEPGSERAGLREFLAARCEADIARM